LIVLPGAERVVDDPASLRLRVEYEARGELVWWIQKDFDDNVRAAVVETGVARMYRRQEVHAQEVAMMDAQGGEGKRKGRQGRSGLMKMMPYP